jgi:hypothetical protein
MRTKHDWWCRVKRTSSQQGRGAINHKMRFLRSLMRERFQRFATLIDPVDRLCRTAARLAAPLTLGVCGPLGLLHFILR